MVANVSGQRYVSPLDSTIIFAIKFSPYNLSLHIVQFGKDHEYWYTEYTLSHAFIKCIASIRDLARWRRSRPRCAAIYFITIWYKITDLGAATTNTMPLITLIYSRRFNSKGIARGWAHGGIGRLCAGYFSGWLAWIDCRIVLHV